MVIEGLPFHINQFLESTGTVAELNNIRNYRFN